MCIPLTFTVYDDLVLSLNNLGIGDAKRYRSEPGGGHANKSAVDKMELLALKRNRICNEMEHNYSSKRPPDDSEKCFRLTK